jgi:prevent-host-death family protein
LQRPFTDASVAPAAFRATGDVIYDAVVLFRPTRPHLKPVPHPSILVSMTRIVKATSKKSPRPPGHWPLQDAKARFSELVRRARSEGPQHVTVHGRDEVVVVAAEEFHRLKGDRTGAALIAALQASPSREVDIAPKRERLPVRDVKL